MRIRTKSFNIEYLSSKLYSVTEIIVIYGTGNFANDFLSNYDVFLVQSGTWKSMDDAFQNHDLITDIDGAHFFEPATKEDRERGYSNTYTYGQMD